MTTEAGTTFAVTGHGSESQEEAEIQDIGGLDLDAIEEDEEDADEVMRSINEMIKKEMEEKETRH